MRYGFYEKKLGADFCLNIKSQVLSLIESGSSFTMFGMPAVGMSLFFRNLVTTNKAFFIYLDIYSLQRWKKEELFLSLYKELGGEDNKISQFNAFELCYKQLQQLLHKKKQIVIILTNFEYLKDEFVNGIFASLKILGDLSRQMIVFIISSSKPYHELNEIVFHENHYAFLSTIVYFPPLAVNDLKKLLILESERNTKSFKEAMLLSGGHITLLQLLLKTENFEKPLEDGLIKLHLKILYETCTTTQKNQLRKIANGKHVASIDSYLKKVGMIRKVANRYELFSPLYRDYVLSYTRMKLSKKEQILFSLLRKHLGNIVSKEEIFKRVWENAFEDGSEWALNALIYRLRRNTIFRNNDYIIENNKGLGYKLVKNNNSIYSFIRKRVSKKQNIYNITINCPDRPEIIKKIIDAGSQAGAGKIGDYTRCAMIVKGEETWITGKDAHPFIGMPGLMSIEPSARIIMQAPEGQVEVVVDAVVRAHPYEQPVVEVTKLIKQLDVLSIIQRKR